MQVDLLKSIEANEPLREEWNQLVLKMEFPQVFFTWEWALAVERAFRSSLQPWIFTCRNNRELVGVAAMACTPSKGARVFFLGGSTGDYCDVISAPEDRADVIGALFASLRQHGIREAIFANIPEDSATLTALSQARHSSYWPSSRIAYVCSRITFQQQTSAVTTEGAFSRLSFDLAKDEKFRRMSRTGPVRLLHLTESTEAMAAQPSIVRAQVSRFLATSRLSPLLMSERRDFLAELTTLLSQRRWLDVAVLKVGDRDVAWNFGFRFEGVIFWYLPTFEMAMESFSPGASLLRLMAQESRHDAEIKEIDLGLGDEGYKGRIANSSRTTWEVTLSSNLVGHSTLAIKRMLVRPIKAWPSLENSVRSIVQFAARMKEAIARRRLLSKLKNRFHGFAARTFSRDEVAFFEWKQNNATQLHSHNISLVPLTWDALADAALCRHDDPEALSYLMRAARRMRNSKDKTVRGYMLVNESGEALHYCWATRFNGFHLSEIQYTCEANSDAVMIFDCWTPKETRGMHYFRIAIERLATNIQEQGKAAWIFSALRNRSSLHALQESQFAYRYSLVRRNFIYRMPVARLDFESGN